MGTPWKSTDFAVALLGSAPAFPFETCGKAPFEIGRESVLLVRAQLAGDAFFLR